MVVGQIFIYSGENYAKVTGNSAYESTKIYVYNSNKYNIIGGGLNNTVYVANNHAYVSGDYANNSSSEFYNTNFVCIINGGISNSISNIGNHAEVIGASAYQSKSTVKIITSIV